MTMAAQARSEMSFGRTLCAGRLAGALHGGTRRLEGRGEACRPAEHSSPQVHGDHPFRARARRRALRRSGRRQGRHRQARRNARQLREAKDAYWAEQVDIQRQVATAWVLYAEGKHDDALKAMSAAADAEDKTEKAPVTPGPLAPARELYGVMLLERGMAKEALAAFEATMTKEPNRFNGYVGAAKAARRSATPRKRRRLMKSWSRLRPAPDSDRPTLAAARAFVASN